MKNTSDSIGRKKIGMHARRLELLPPYLFVEIDRAKEKRWKAGSEILDLGIGDPDLGAPPELVKALFDAISSGKYDRYPPDRGLPVLIEAIRKWASRSQGVALDPEEILVTIGSKEAIGHLALSMVDEGDIVIVPDPGYPVYRSSAALAGAHVVVVQLDPEDGFNPRLDSLRECDLEKTRLFFLNFPNNPTGATVGDKLYERWIDLAKNRDMVLAADSAYCEIWYENPHPLFFPIAREAGIPYIELFSFSKTFSIAGWRIGFAIGSPDVISALSKLKNNLDSGVFGAIQCAVATVLDESYETITCRIRSTYKARRDLLADEVKRSSLQCEIPRASFYFWIKTPDGIGSIDFCRYLLEEMGIVATPGVGFGQNGEGYFRLSVTADTDTILEAGKRLSSLGERLGKL